MDLEHPAWYLMRAGIHSVGLLSLLQFYHRPAENGLTCSLCLFTHSLFHSFIHLIRIYREAYNVHRLHWALVLVLEERLMKGSLERQRRPLSLPAVLKKAPWRR